MKPDGRRRLPPVIPDPEKTAPRARRRRDTRGKGATLLAARVAVSIAVGGSLAAPRVALFVDHVVDAGLFAQWDGPVFDARPLPRRHVAALCLTWPRGWARGAPSLARRDRDAVQALPFLGRWRGCSVRLGPEFLVFTCTNDARSFAADHDEAPVICRMTAGRLGSDAAILSNFAGADVAVSRPVASQRKIARAIEPGP